MQQLRDRQRQRGWRALQRAPLERPAEADAIDWSRAAVESRGVLAEPEGQTTGSTPTEKGNPGSKQHLVCNRQGIPLGGALICLNYP